jgi:hypothetical protein
LTPAVPDGSEPSSDDSQLTDILRTFRSCTEDNVSVTMFAQKDFICDG